MNCSAYSTRAIISGISVPQKVSLGEMCSCFWKLPQVPFEYGWWESWEWLRAAAVFCRRWVIHITRISLVKVVILQPVITTGQWKLFQHMWCGWSGAATQLQMLFLFQFCYIFVCFKGEDIVNILKLSIGGQLKSTWNSGVTKNHVLQSLRLFWDCCSGFHWKEK